MSLEKRRWPRNPCCQSNPPPLQHRPGDNLVLANNFGQTLEGNRKYPKHKPGHSHRYEKLAPATKKRLTSIAVFARQTVTHAQTSAKRSLSREGRPFKLNQDTHTVFGLLTWVLMMLIVLGEGSCAWRIVSLAAEGWLRLWVGSRSSINFSTELNPPGPLS